MPRSSHDLDGFDRCDRTAREWVDTVAEHLGEDPHELLPDARVVAVAGQVDEHRQIAVVDVAADEHAYGAALAVPSRVSQTE